MALALTSFSLITLYNLDLRAYIIEPYFESLPQTIKDVNIKQNWLYGEQPADVDSFIVGWMRFVHNKAFIVYVCYLYA